MSTTTASPTAGRLVARAVSTITLVTERRDGPAALLPRFVVRRGERRIGWLTHFQVGHSAGWIWTSMDDRRSPRKLTLHPTPALALTLDSGLPAVAAIDAVIANPEAFAARRVGLDASTTQRLIADAHATLARGASPGAALGALWQRIRHLPPAAHPESCQ